MGALLSTEGVWLYLRASVYILSGQFSRIQACITVVPMGAVTPRKKKGIVVVSFSTREARNHSPVDARG